MSQSSRSRWDMSWAEKTQIQWHQGDRHSWSRGAGTGLLPQHIANRLDQRDEG